MRRPSAQRNVPVQEQRGDLVSPWWARASRGSVGSVYARVLRSRRPDGVRAACSCIRSLTRAHYPRRGSCPARTRSAFRLSASPTGCSSDNPRKLEIGPNPVPNPVPRSVPTSVPRSITRTLSGMIALAAQCQRSRSETHASVGPARAPARGPADVRVPAAAGRVHRLLRRRRGRPNAEGLTPSAEWVITVPAPNAVRSGRPPREV